MKKDALDLDYGRLILDAEYFLEVGIPYFVKTEKTLVNALGIAYSIGFAAGHLKHHIKKEDKEGIEALRTNLAFCLTALEASFTGKDLDLSLKDKDDPDVKP